jgi:mannosyl-3-phosphoglycerate phosphatase
MPLDNELTQHSPSRTGFEHLIVFSDLDGTLLDHKTYSHVAATAALDRLRALGVPLILASSKTAAEVAPLRAELGFAHCEAIVENGAGIVDAHGAGSGSEEAHRRILNALAGVPAPLRKHFQGFSDWSIEETARRTQLPIDQARKAKQRQFSEPGLWSGSEAELKTFLALLDAEGITAQQGGRFMTLSFGSDKAQCMAKIKERHAKADPQTFAVALGDASNDIAMLNAADLGIIIPNPGHGGIPRLEGEASGRIIRASRAGPAGWNEAVLRVLNSSQGD